MKIIKVSTELEMSVHEFPSGTIREHNKALCELIGNGCDLVEHVMPKRLYTELKMPSSPALGYVIPDNKGSWKYISKLGYSADDPEVRYPVEVNASSSNGYADGLIRISPPSAACANVIGAVEKIFISCLWKIG